MLITDACGATFWNILNAAVSEYLTTVSEKMILNSVTFCVSTTRSLLAGSLLDTAGGCRSDMGVPWLNKIRDSWIATDPPTAPPEELSGASCVSASQLLPLFWNT
jgi:hypothetical protein